MEYVIFSLGLAAFLGCVFLILLLPLWPSIIGFRFSSKSRLLTILVFNILAFNVVVFAVLEPTVASWSNGVLAYDLIFSSAFWFVALVLALRSKPGLWERFLRFVVCLFLIAVVLRALFLQPFNIPDGGNIPTLLVGDYLLVSKYSYGYTHYSLPLSPELFPGRIPGSWLPQRGDVVVYRLPKDDSRDYIHRIVGLSGDKIQVVHGVLNINGVPVKRERITDGCVAQENIGQPVMCFRETLPNGVTYITHDFTDNGFLDNTEVYTVPPGNYFMMADNRDNSADSRVQSRVGYVPFENLIGKAQIIFFSIGGGAAAWQIGEWSRELRWNRFLTLIR